MGLERKCGCGGGCGCSDFDPFTEVNNDPMSKKLNKEVDSKLEELNLNSYEQEEKISDKFYSFFKSIVDYFKS
ncbi:MAG: hypothetical protein KKB62_01620 [Nanoarchaeota archaeon]|nr:hypothetical protein [Nanoarchaeota archaeon]